MDELSYGCFVTREWENTAHLGLGRVDGFP